MKQIQSLIREVFENYEYKMDRTGTGTWSKFGTMLRWNMADGFPAQTTKKLFWQGVVGELLWFMRGETNVEVLREITFGKGSTRKTIWDDNFENQGKSLGYTDGELGPVYGYQWRNFGDQGYDRPGVDQLRQVIETIKSNPESRRMIISAWNPVDIPHMSLPPCHVMMQFIVHDGKLSLRWDQRSVDVFLGLPFNIASYALLLHIVARITGLVPHELIMQAGDTHIYDDHVEQCKEVLRREPRPLPSLYFPSHFKTLDDFLNAEVKDFALINYTHHPVLKGKMAV
ncbi:thymidylate synthase [Serratia phage Muldoon]|uniref:Thymidylate synthase n=1 Tax=Serratia phage Muldoon TaxID=2601678 RepID=A0A5P8PHK9_9CAUD|nr:thymidylate synthase [Serratia phage Muldoon]QFR56183.1 thymidylate synthase [Serratia phage Muldoon]